MELCHFFLFVTFVVLTVDQFVKRGDGPFELQKQYCWAQQCCLLLRDVSRCVQTLATSHNMLGLSMRIRRTLGRFPSPTPFLFLVRMYLCGCVACSARAPAQHCWMCCANKRNIVGPRFDDRETIKMLALVGSEV